MAVVSVLNLLLVFMMTLAFLSLLDLLFDFDSPFITLWSHRAGTPPGELRISATRAPLSMPVRSIDDMIIDVCVCGRHRLRAYSVN